ncbi:MAG: Peptide deformylase [Parcubacteria group bacterium GW2011_GWA2_40_8]|nr:MAG: Peptide deformylase [Parcubacteria group bacterium GW2011_GWB1_40_14]KKR79211.1 MAG: Peptide deformylase [Parcubacteria group bacterium GW2011_GWA2_40_8]
MTTLQTIQEPNYPLRDRSLSVKPKNDNFLYLKDLCDTMRDTMRFLDGIGIAAPQIGESKRIFLIETSLFPDIAIPSDIFINPKILKRSFKQTSGEEGCLSVKGMYGTVKRAKTVTLEAYDINGEKFKLKASDLLARVFQHETDHLEGILYIDKALPSSLHIYIKSEEYDK